MRKTFLLLLLFCGSIGVYAQNTEEATDVEKKLAKINVDGWKSKLVLTVKQSEEMLEVVTQYEMGKNMIYKSDTEMDVKNKDLEELEKAHYVKVGELLSEKQFATFNELIAEIKSGS